MSHGFMAVYNSVRVRSDIRQVLRSRYLLGQGQGPARQAAIHAGIPSSVPAYGVNMLCGSGLKAVALGYQAVLSDKDAVIVAGGQESMSQVGDIFLISVFIFSLMVKGTVTPGAYEVG